jgi:pimeloyl-ACP methyl ester carboxylesterase
MSELDQVLASIGSCEASIEIGGTVAAVCRTASSVVGGLRVLYSEVSTVQAGELVLTHQSATQFDEAGNATAFYMASEVDARWLRYGIAPSGLRLLSSNFGVPVAVLGSLPRAVIDHNNIGALLHLMQLAARNPDVASTGYCVLLPEPNRAVHVVIRRVGAVLFCDALGISFDTTEPNRGRGTLRFTSPQLGLLVSGLSDGVTREMNCRKALLIDELRAPPADAAPQVTFVDEESAVGHSASPIAWTRSNANSGVPRRGLVFLHGGSGEYDPRGFTRLGSNLGYERWIASLCSRGYDVVSIARASETRPAFSTYRAALVSLIQDHLKHDELRDGALVLVGHSLGGLLMADVAAEFSCPNTQVVMVATPARGLRKTIQRQSFCQAAVPFRRPTPSDRPMLRSQAENLQEYLHGKVVSVVADLRRGDMPFINRYADTSARDLMARWPYGARLVVVHGTEDEKVDVADADRWMTAAQELGIESSLLKLAGLDHTLDLAGAPADQSCSIDKVVDLLVEL